MKVELSAQAESQIIVIDAWWRENRPAVAEVFISEFERAVTSLESSPNFGTRYEARPTVRRLLLRKTRYHVYFVREKDTLYVMAVWSAFRGKGPKL